MEDSFLLFTAAGVAQVQNKKRETKEEIKMDERFSVSVKEKV